MQKRLSSVEPELPELSVSQSCGMEVVSAGFFIYISSGRVSACPFTAPRSLALKLIAR